MEFKHPERRVLLCRAIYTLCIAIIPLTISVVLFHLPMVPARIPPIFTAMWLSLTIILLTVYHPLDYRRMRYAVTDDSIVTVRGVLFTVRRRMPLAAVRHITALRGPMERILGLSTLLVTAVGGHLLIEGLTADDAETLAKTLLR